MKSEDTDHVDSSFPNEEEQLSEETSRGFEDEIEYLMREITPRALQNLQCEKPTVLQKTSAPYLETHFQMCKEQMDKLIQVSEILLTDFKAISEFQETRFHQDRMNRAEQMKQSIQTDTIETLARMREIKGKHTELNHYTDVKIKDFSNKFDEQVKRMDDLMVNKDLVIDKLKDNYEKMTSFFQKDIDKHTKEIGQMSDRVLKQLDLIRFTHTAQLDQLEQKLFLERQSKMKLYNETFNYTLQKRNKLKEALYEIQQIKFDYYSEDIDFVLKNEKESAYRNRVFLEKESEALFEEMEKDKEIIFKRYEMIIYNLDILGLKDVENKILYKQARNRYGEVLHNIAKVKTKLENLKVRDKMFIPKMIKRNEKLHLDMTNMKKDENFMKFKNYKMFQDIWRSTFKEINNIATKVFEIDRVLHEQVIMKPWVHIKLPEFENFGIDTRGNARKSYAAYQKQSKVKATLKRLSKPKSQMPPPPPNKNEEKRFLRNVLRIIGDCAGDLVESNLKLIIRPYSEPTRQIFEMDKIFEALQVNNDPQDIENLTKAFRPYFWCKVCSDGPTKEMLKTLFRERRLSVDTEYPQSRRVKKPCEKHTWVTDENFILFGMVEFLKDHEDTILERKTMFQLTSASFIIPDEFDIAYYWQQVMNFIPPSKIILWKFLEHSLKHFNVELKKRHRLITQCDQLRRQNAELRHLLKNYLP